MIKAVKGTRDLLPPETALWNFVEAAVRDVFRAYNFHEIRTPIFESTELFARGVGEETDIVSKEMYTWYDGPETDATLHGAWNSQRASRYSGTSIVSSGTREGISITVSGGAEPYLIELKRRPDATSIARLEARKRDWLAAHPGSK